MYDCVTFRIVYYTHTAFLEPALQLTRSISPRAELHVLLEVGPMAWQHGLFDVQRDEHLRGLVDGRRLLLERFPPAVRDYWKGAASFQMVVHTANSSLHPASWQVSREVVRFIRALRPSVVHFDDVDVSPRMALVSPLLADAPIVVSVHDPNPHLGEYPRRKDFARWLMFKRAQRFVLHHDYAKSDFKRRYKLPPERVHIVRFGAYDVFRSWLDERAHQDPRTVLFFGRLSPYKGLEVLYRAAPSVAREVPGVRFVIAGQAVAGYQLPVAPALPNGGCFEMINGQVSNAHAARLFARASVVVCPYVEASQSGVVLTAFAFERPVVATRVGGLPEYVQDDVSGILVPPEDPQALAVGLIRVLKDASLQGRYRVGIAELVAGPLSWSRAADQLLSVYASAGA